MKQHLPRIAPGLLVVLLFIGHAANWYRLPFIETLEAIVYDARLRLTMPNDVDPRIVIIDIDDKSLAAEGHWPWRRDRLGLLLDRLFDQYGVRLVAFDVVFAERDQSSGLNVLQDLGRKELQHLPQFQSALAQIAPRLQYDRIFAGKIKGRPVVLGYYFTPVAGASGTGTLPEPVLPKGLFHGRNVQPVDYAGYGANLPELQAVALSAGHFNPDPDADGVSRLVPMLAEYQGAYYEPLSLAVVRALLGSPDIEAGFTDAPGRSKNYPGLEWLQVGRLRIPVDGQARALIPYRGARGSFPYVSAVDVIAGKADPAQLKDRIVLVGTTAPGLLDLRSTPVEPVYPGVEIHANLIAGMLDNNIKQKPAYVLGAEVVLLVVCGLILALLLPLLDPVRVALVTLLALALLIGGNIWVWQNGLVLPLACATLMILILFALNMSYGFFVESRAKRQITDLFGQYVPPQLVNEMSENPEKFSMEGESRELSVLFTDVRGFTTISEGLEPRELSRLMNEFLTPLTEVIYRHRGTIDKYMGDCIMAFWGAPLGDPEHARSAVLAGLDMLTTMEALQPQFKARGWPELHIGVGVNSGRMSVGNMGSRIRVAYTVMGDAVNLASRLEGLTRQYGVGMIVGENTRRAAPDLIYRELDRVRVKGKNEPVTIYQPVGDPISVDAVRRGELELWQQTLRFYRAQDWDRAELQLINLQRSDSERALYSAYLSRIAEMRRAPPPADWDGAVSFESK